jgi:hypothetical protein
VETTDLRQLAQSLTRREFIEKHSHFFLVLNAHGDSQKPMTSFATEVMPSREALLEARDLIVLPIVKSANSPFQAHISLGRARNCDIVIRHPSVSKLHARFRHEAEGSLLADAGSQNGTFVDGKRLLPNEAVPVAADSRLLFGSVPARYIDAGGLYTLLARSS